MSIRKFRSVAIASLLAGGCVVEHDSFATQVAEVKGCTVEQGQLLIDTARYDAAVRELTCVIDAQPTEVEGYRGRIEAQLLRGRFSDAFADYARVTAFVLPVHPDAATTILAGYAARLAVAPQSIPALTGASFARWWLFQYAQAVQQIDQLLAVAPDDVYGNLFRGSSRVLLGATPAAGVADLERAIELAPQSPDVHWIVADAYTYGQSDPARAFAEATLALDGGLDTPRVHAILASSQLAFGDVAAAAAHLQQHIDLVTIDLVTGPPLGAGTTKTLDLVPGRTFELAVSATAGQTISIVTGSPGHAIWDTIIVLLAPDGTPLIGSDDAMQYYGAFDWVASATGTYRLQVTSFESVDTGAVSVTRK